MSINSLRLVAALVAILVVPVSAPVSSAAEGAPMPPVRLAYAAVEGAGIVLTWAPSVEATLDATLRFRVYRSVAGSDYALLAETGATFFLDLAPEGGSRVYAVTAVGPTGVESDPIVYTTPGDGQCIRSSMNGVTVSPRDCWN